RQLVAAASKGRWVHQHLYRRMPYRRIRLPCPAAGCGVLTGCCPQSLPRTLHATGDHRIGTVALVYDGSPYRAPASILADCGDALDLRFACGTGGTDCSSFSLETRCNGGPWFPFSIALGCTCSPLNVQFSTFLNPVQGCTSCQFATLNFTVTT